MSVLSSNWKNLLAQQKLAAAASAAKPKQQDDGKKKKVHKRVDRSAPKTETKVEAVVIEEPSGPLPNVVAMDCEMVGVGIGGASSALARVSIVDFAGGVLYDKYVKPVEKVVDYRTAVSGIEPRHIHGPDAIEFRQCQIEVAAIIDDKILVGHAIHHDLQVLLLSHPRHMIRDTSRHKELCPRKPRALKTLVKERLHLTIQEGKHDSVEDARCVMMIYKQLRKEWEKTLSNKGAKVRAVVASKKAKASKKEGTANTNDNTTDNNDNNNNVTNTSSGVNSESFASVGSTITTNKRKRPSTSIKQSSKVKTTTSSTSPSTSTTSTPSSVDNNEGALVATFSRPNKKSRPSSSTKSSSSSTASSSSSSSVKQKSSHAKRSIK